MKIGILGVGHIGKTLARALSAAGHEVKVANSRGPETVDPEALVHGATAVSTPDAVRDVDVVILSVPFHRLRDVIPVVAEVPLDTVVIDTSNYYPFRDNEVEAIEGGQVESVWVAEQLGRPIAKAWNAIGAASFAANGKPAGSPGRLAIPVAASDDKHRKVALQLVEDTGFTAFDAGSLEDSWRQQPGTPCYCTDLTESEIQVALPTADRARSPKRRDLSVAVFAERYDDSMANPDEETMRRVNRALFM